MRKAGASLEANAYLTKRSEETEVVLSIGRDSYYMTPDEASQLAAQLASQAEVITTVDNETSSPEGGIKIKLREGTAFYKACFQILNPYGDFS